MPPAVGPAPTPGPDMESSSSPPPPGDDVPPPPPPGNIMAPPVNVAGPCPAASLVSPIVTDELGEGWTLSWTFGAAEPPSLTEDAALVGELGLKGVMFRFGGLRLHVSPLSIGGIGADADDAVAFWIKADLSNVRLRIGDSHINFSDAVDIAPFACEEMGDWVRAVVPLSADSLASPLDDHDITFVVGPRASTIFVDEIGIVEL